MKDTIHNNTEFDKELALLKELCLLAVKGPRLQSFHQVVDQMVHCTPLVESQLLRLHDQISDEVKRERPDLIDNVEKTRSDDTDNLKQWRKRQEELTETIADGQANYPTRAIQTTEAIIDLISQIRRREEILATCQFSLQEDTDFRELGKN